MPDNPEEGCWSGSLAVYPDGPRIYYSQVDVNDYNRSRICVAVPLDDDWRRWEKLGAVDLRGEPGAKIFRDPFVHRADGWRMLVGGGDSSGHAAVYAFATTDHTEWVYQGRLLSAAPGDVSQVWTGTAWECPSIVNIDGRDALVFSVWEEDRLHHVVACLAEPHQHFTLDGLRQISFGPSYYAATTFQDEDGGACLMFWMRGIRDDAETTWTGALSVPCRISVEGRGIRLEPHPALDRLRSGNPERVGAAVSLPLYGELTVHVNRPEAEMRLDLRSDSLPCLEIIMSPDRVQVTADGELFEVPREQVSDRWTILRDGPVLEVFFGLAVFGCRVPCTFIGASVAGGELEVLQFDVGDVSPDGRA
jgi:beta-fructofuranosidase